MDIGKKTMKRFLRSILSGLCFLLFGVGGIISGAAIVPFVLIFCSKNTQRRVLSGIIHYSWKLFVWFMCVLRLIQIKTDNPKALKNMRGKIVIANHPSLIDVVILVAKIPYSICLVKGALFQNIFIRNLIKHVYISNSMEPDQFIKQATEILHNGYNIIIFPEGTRTKPDKKIHMHRGFAHLHLYSKNDIQPIHISNDPKILGKGQAWYDVGVKISCYTLDVLPKIRFKKTLGCSERQNAIRITNLAQKALF